MNAWSVEVDCSGASKARESWAHPIVAFGWNELSLEVVFNAKHGLSVVGTSSEHHTGREPVWDLKREGVGHLARARRTIHHLSKAEILAVDGMLTGVSPGDSILSLLMFLSEMGLFTPI